MTTPKEMLTVDEAAARMKMSTRHIRRLVDERRIAYHRLGRSIRLDPVDVDAYIASNRVEPITEADVWRDMRQVG
jgi:excisionase family DNA binding protein